MGSDGGALVGVLAGAQQVEVDALVVPVDEESLRVGTGRYLDEDERIHIADRLRDKASVCTIAAKLGRNPSTISRKIHRNRYPSNHQYDPPRRTRARRPRPKGGKIGANLLLREIIQHHVGMKWSPEQISHHLRLSFPDQAEMHVCHETIYQALYVQGRGELRRELIKALRTGRIPCAALSAAQTSAHRVSRTRWS